jgi:hypothetical protein
MWLEVNMITYNELKEKCNCWTGYKRKPGTKPCAEDSCMKEELEKHHVLAFGRMNPITSGHEAVVNKLHSVAKEHGASHSLVVSHSQDAKKNPLTGEQKVAHAKNAFPGTKVSSASKEAPTILHHAAAAHAAGATHLHVIAGSDRHEEMHNLLHKYNGKDSSHGHYNFKKITVHSSGERDPDAEGTTGISASKMREHAASGNKAEFHKGAPSNMKPEHKDAMYNDVRKGMNIKEELRSDMGAAAYINDFIKSTNPRFNNKSKEERRKMAIGAFMAAKSRLKEDNSHYDEAEEHLSKANDADAKGDIKAFHAHMADHHDCLSMWHDSKGRSASADKHAEKAEFHHEKSLTEGTLQGNIGGGDAMNTTTSAPSASTVKDTTMGKKIKGFKFFNGENDKQMNMNQPVKEEKKDDVPFDGPYKSTFKKPNNPNRTGMDAARSLAQRAMDQLNKKKPVKEQFETEFTVLEEAAKAIDSGEYDYEGQMARTQLQTTLRNCQDLIGMIEDDENMPEWVQSKITLAQDYITTVRDYLQSKEELGEETLDERNKANALMRKTMDASRGAKFKLKNPVPDADPKHKTARDHNVAIGRALRNEATTGNPGFGYHGQHKTEHDADEAYKNIHAHVKSLTDSDDKTVKHYLDSAHGRHLVGREQDHEYVKKDFKKFSKYYKPEMHEATAQKGVNVDKVNHAGDIPHEEKWEEAPKTVSKLKKVKEENMKSYKEFLQSLDEKLIGKQHKIDKNKNGKVDEHDFELLRKEEADHLLEYTPGPDGKTIIKGRSYGADYVDPEGAFETAADMKKADKKPAGRKTGQRTGSYKPRATMSKLKAAGSTYK